LGDYPFHTSGDTEVLAAAFVKWGPDCAKRLKGMFAFAVWDRVEETLYLCRDRMGVKPLYFHHSEDRLVFASEIRSMLVSGLIQRKLDASALPGYFSFQSFAYPAAPIQGIRQVEAGTYLKISGGRIEQTVYWSLFNQESLIDRKTDAGIISSIRDLLLQSVERRLISDVPVGAFLSGGLDSSMIVGLMAEVSHERPCTFNVSFSEKDFDEAAYAELVAKKFNTRHTGIRLRPEAFLHDLEDALDAMDSPSGDGINTFMVSRGVRNAGIHVALSGLGGDELFGRYPYFRHYLSMRRMKGLFDHTSGVRKFFSRMMEPSASLRFSRMGSFLAARQMSIGHIYPVFRRILTPGLLSQLTYLRYEGIPQCSETLLQHEKALEKMPLLSQFSVAEYLGYTQQTLLKDTDQMSMAVSLEVREPFFDHNLVEYMMQVPDSIKLEGSGGRSLAASLVPQLPREILQRSKQGFLFPWQVWMKQQLKSFCEARINRMAERDFVRGDALKKYWKRFLHNDPGVRWSELWLFVVLEHWIEKNHVEA
jgi:asparagine synthase (glutamine-hydrolysing)